jgi:GTP cyclohydrolase II
VGFSINLCEDSEGAWDECKYNKSPTNRAALARCVHPHADQVGDVRCHRLRARVSNGTRRVETALALVMVDTTEEVPLLRIHSQCLTGEVLGSLRCDCHDQLEMAMQAIGAEGRGLVIYEYQEGRGIGLQDAGLDTVEANHAPGFKADCRDFSLPAAIVRDLGIKWVRLLSNNPSEARALSKSGVEVVVQLSSEAAPNPHSLPTCGPRRKEWATP